MEIGLEVGYGYLVKVEDTCGKPSISLTKGEYITEMLHCPRATRGYDRYREVFAKFRKCLTCETRLTPIMVHRGKQDLPRSTLLRLMSPREQPLIRWYATTINRHDPLSIRLLPGINGYCHKLTPKVMGELRYKIRSTHGRRVHADFIRTSRKQSVSIRQLAYATTDSERYIDVPCYTLHKVGERLTLLMARGNIKEHKLISSLTGIFSTKLDRVTYVLDVDEVDSLNGLSVTNIETRDYAFGYHLRWYGLVYSAKICLLGGIGS